MRSWSISRRLVVTLVVLIGGIWLAGSGIAALMIRHEIDEVFDSSLQETAQRLLPLALDDLRRRDREDDEESGRTLVNPFSAEEHEEYLHYQVRDAQGDVLLRSHDASAEPFPAPLKRGYFDDGDRRYFTEVAPDRTIFVQVAELPAERQEAISALWLGLTVPLLGLLPIAAFVVYWTVRRATHPITQVQQQIAKRSGENLDPIDPRGLPDELVPIIQDMNRLLERLKAALEAERAFAANSAHELRNPIAAARAQAELIAENLRGSPDHARAIQLVGVLGQLGKRIEKMLQLARAEAGLGLDRTETDILAVTQLVAADYARRPQLGERVVFDSGTAEPVIVAIDPDALGIALQNLMDNAFAHGRPGTPVSVAVGPGPRIHIVNEGPVVGSDELADLTERFTRAGATRAPGTGLGLSIVDQIMRQAGGRLDLASPAPGKKDGFAATLVFPAH
jgi:two-component system, OmpR family, sensor kinase